MSRTRIALPLLALLLPAVAVLPMNAGATHCDPFQTTTVSTNTISVTVPVPGSVGPVTVPQQTVGGQTVGPVTVPLLASVSGVPVVGTVTIGGQTVGPVTLPQETVGPVSVGPVPTGLDPVTITVFGQSANVPLDASCLSQLLAEEIQTLLACVRDILGGGSTCAISLV